jgi:hypothetical protein
MKKKNGREAISEDHFIGDKGLVSRIYKEVSCMYEHRIMKPI